VLAVGYFFYRRKLMLTNKALKRERSPSLTLTNNLTQTRITNLSLETLSTPNMLIDPQLIKLMGNESVNALTFLPNEHIYEFNMEDFQDLGLLEGNFFQKKMIK
jgi:hypothetical protein